MTREQALIELRDKVKAGDALDVQTFLHAFPAWKPLQKWPLMDLLEWACDADDIRAMGAAKALHEAVLPEWVITIERVNSGRWIVTLRLEPRIGTVQADDDNPARAWLLAAIEALIAQEPAQ
jgi:hypothetical protein